VDANDVLDVLDLLAAAGVEAWVDGGWGAPTQVCAHLGYPPSAKDRTDMRLLRDRLGVDLVPPYA
jgi:hypothetical protein